MPVSQLTPAELHAQLKKATLPTLLVEGKTDVLVFRSILRRVAPAAFAPVSCGSRNELLKFYRDRKSFPKGMVAFLADRDFWIVEGVPEEYSELLLTQGYCIENELYSDGKSALMALLYPDEADAIQEILDNVSVWIAYEYNIQLAGGGGEFAKHSILDDAVMAKGQRTLEPDFLLRRGFSAPDTTMVALVQSEEFARVPGKIIFDAFFKVIYKERTNDDYSYAHPHLHDQCIIKAVELDAAKGRIQALLAAIRLSFRN